MNSERIVRRLGGKQSSRALKIVFTPTCSLQGYKFEADQELPVKTLIRYSCKLKCALP